MNLNDNVESMILVSSLAHFGSLLMANAISFSGGHSFHLLVNIQNHQIRRTAHISNGHTETTDIEVLLDGSMYSLLIVLEHVPKLLEVVDAISNGPSDPRSESSLETIIDLGLSAKMCRMSGMVIAHLIHFLRWGFGQS